VSLKEAWNTEHVWQRGMRFQDEQGNDHIGSAVHFLQEPAQIRTYLPPVGAETAEILAELDLTDDDREVILGTLG
jgi:crotonobetainyl-CoA:carnitine CoA-transferase CaiB-like acyl-CoA transferase